MDSLLGQSIQNGPLVVIAAAAARVRDWIFETYTVCSRLSAYKPTITDDDDDDDDLITTRRDDALEHKTR